MYVQDYQSCHKKDNDPSNDNRGFPCSSVSKESACNARDSGLIPGSGRIPGEGNGNPLQYSCLQNPMDREAWQATVHAVKNTSMYASNRAFGAAVTKSGHKAAAFLQHPVLFLFFPLSVHSLLFSIGVELISETVFLSGVQELYSVILRCLTLLSLGSCSI